ncbi:DUF2845 domain-containing protein [Phytopseudomonas dryadis]|uniref:DUF2845 domain-containing protein n=1 Tax=Phytopseudomonas dryadis TaxID=2487520 RepID=A0A4Q9R2N0_9GAMM|nr:MULTISPECIES: DUF2845 domain-containing protein [Pseudomonas]TBU93466.1 hypothetical protein DNK44_10820 [Pseudomonas dryadis]TBV07025.1 hypothetical protein DNK34_09365 [Pseudomonas dryadis]TBV19582.1 hypothetical protein DNK41_03350 [Pseudomonas sp. FRB 230]
MLLLLLISTPSLASMRCGTALVTLDDTLEQVQEKCGDPEQRRINPPALRPNGVPRFNAAEVQHWVYGPHNGAYRHLRFIDGKLVDIRTERAR